MDKLQNQIT